MKAMNIGRLIALATLAVSAPGALAQTYLLDDRPQSPLLGFPGFGAGAESPWGFPTAAGAPTGPSPVLPAVPGAVSGDGDLLGPGLTVTAAPGIPYLGSLSGAQNPGAGGRQYHLYFSVDRVTVGSAASAVRQQTAVNQQPGDVFRGGTIVAAPARFIGTMAARPAPFAGVLPSVLTAIPGNALETDEAQLGLPADLGGALLPPGVAAAPLAAGTHNNVDGFDHASLASGGALTAWAYQTTYPDDTFPFGIPTADIFDLAPGATVFCGLIPFASTASLGLNFGDVIDGLVMFDTAPQGSAGCGGPGAQPGVDGVLFSLAQGSPSLFQTGRSPGDVFFSDFSGNFGVFASAAQLGLAPNPGGSAAASGDNIDALEFGCLGDLDHDGVVATPDIVQAFACTGTPGCADFNLDGITNATDIVLLAGNVGCTGG
ncbi:MAG: hypothetical protein AAFU65_01125 [Pseudomonadota bacterium]